MSSDRANASGWVVAALVVTVAAASAVGLHALGRAVRPFGTASALGTPGPEILLVRTNGGAAVAWRSRGLRGRVVLHAGRFLHFVTEERAFRPMASGPGSGGDWAAAVFGGAGKRNHLWVAAVTGVARRVHYLSPPGALRERLQAIGRSGSALPLDIDERALPRTIDAAPPRLAEPVLLDVNASWFDESGGDELLVLLRAAGTTADVVTLSLAEGNEDVSDAARERVRAFAAKLGAREERVAP